MAGKVENEKLEEYENETYYLLWSFGEWHFPYNRSLGMQVGFNLDLTFRLKPQVGGIKLVTV